MEHLVERVKHLYDLQKNVVIVCGEGIVDEQGRELGAETKTTDPAGNIALSGAAEAVRYKMMLMSATNTSSSTGVEQLGKRSLPERSDTLREEEGRSCSIASTAPNSALRPSNSCSRVTTMQCPLYSTVQPRAFRWTVTMEPIPRPLGLYSRSADGSAVVLHKIGVTNHPSNILRASTARGQGLSIRGLGQQEFVWR